MDDAHPPWAAVREAVARSLAEDLGPLGDITSALMPPALLARGALVARGGGVFAGRRCVEEVFAQVDGSVSVEWRLDDGDALAAGDGIAAVAGPARSVLTGERSALNLACHLSGVASLTRLYVQAVAGTGCRILDTRKTTPGLRSLEKAAVRAGGGANHRGSLSDMVLLKDNHLAGLRIAEAVAAARRRWPMRTVEVECDRLGQVHEAVAAGAEVVMLDNMTPDEVAQGVALVGGRALVEVSGGVNLDTVAAYAAAGADLVSVGALTASAPSFDIGLDLIATGRN
ncbi:MAG: carboxylating nicotinate-nucleotide diphosphorylase [Acidimicrobiales bacterium]